MVYENLAKSLQLELCKRSAWQFCLYYDEDFFSKRPFLKIVANVFQYLIEGKETPDKIIIEIRNSKHLDKFKFNPKKASCSLSPRAGKSYTVSICCAWVLGKYFNGSILRSTHSQKLFRKFSRHVRYIINTEFFKKVYPGVMLSNDNTDVDGWSLEKSTQGSYFGSGVDGSIVGMGASLIAITDDLYKSYNDAISPAINERTLEFMDSAYESRKEKGCSQFDIGTRWTKNDYMGRNIDNDEYDIIIKIPALNDKEQSFCEDVKTTKEYLYLREKLIKGGKEHIWEGEYQQEPIEVKGLLFPYNLLNYFKLDDLNEEIKYFKYLTIDTADGGQDYYAAIVAYIFDKVYIVDVIFNKFKLSKNKNITIGKIEKHNCLEVIIETNKEGSLYVSNLRDACHNTRIVGYWNIVNKESRIFAVSDWIIDNFVFRTDYEENSDYDLFMKNLTSYLKEGKNVNDDAADVSALAAKYFQERRILR